MAKYVVPEEGMKAVAEATNGYDKQTTTVAIEAFIRWQSENPQVPTDEQCDELISLIGATGRSLVCYPSRIDRGQARTMLTEWQRRMYLAEPEVPEEIKDLLYFGEPNTRVGCKDPIEASKFIDESDRRVLEAFRRGKESQ